MSAGEERKNVSNMQISTAFDIGDSQDIQQKIIDLSRFPEENPFPVLRLSVEGTILYSNGAGRVLLEEWDCRIGGKAPKNWCAFIEKAQAANQYQVREITSGGKIFSFAIVPISGADYVNLYGLDITQQKQTETVLRESEARFRTIFEGNNNGMLITDDVNNKFIMCNDAICRMLGYSRDEITCLSVADIHPQEELLFVRDQFKKLASGEIKTAENIPVKRKDGSIFIADVIANSIVLSGKKYLVGSFRDITERRQAEELLRRSQEDLNRAQSVGNIGSWRLDVRKNELTWSEENHRIFEIPKSTKMTYETFLSMIHPEDREYVDTSWKAALEGKGYDVEHRIVVNGGTKWVREKAYLEFDRNGELIGGFGITQDVTQRKRMQEKLRQAHDELERRVQQRTEDLEHVVKTLEEEVRQRIAAQNRINFTNVLLELFTKKTSRKEYLDAVVDHIHTWSGCQCVGIRLVDDDGWVPYESQVGFSEEFLATENRLSLENNACLCIRAITQQSNASDAPLATPRGSFYSANTFGFLETLNDQEKGRYRGTCLKHGFASLAVIPVRYRNQIVGAIHLADERNNKMSSEVIDFLEHMAMLIGEAVHRFDVEESLWQSQARLLEAQRLAHLGNWQWDMRTGKLFCSEEVYRIFGSESRPKALTYEAFLPYVHPEDRKFVRKSIAAALKEKKALYLEHRIIRPDGNERVVYQTAEITYDENQKPVLMVGAVHDITERKRAEDAIHEHQQSLRAMAAQLQLAEEVERRRIAQDIHDSIGQILAFSTMEINNIRKISPEPLAQSLEAISGHLNEAIKQARTLSFDLSPSVLYDLGFEVAIEDLVERFSEERNISCQFEDCGMSKPLNEEVKVLLYRSVRELLINAAKHAKANTIKVSLLRSSAEMHIIIEDDGEGFDVSTLISDSRKNKGFGLFSVRERLHHVGGYLKIESAQGKGTKAVVIAPLEFE